MSEKTTDIFIRTCFHDRAYHRYCLDSINLFFKGHRKVVEVHGEHPRGYLNQQCEKIRAGDYTDADYLLFTDSDTIFNQPVTPESFMRDGKPMWLYTPWTPEMLAHPGTRAWFDVMTEFFGVEPPAEFMRRMGSIIPREVLQGFRDFCIQKHGVTIDEYVMSRDRFSEFNCIGFYAWQHCPEKFSWINTDEEIPPSMTRQFWSHDDIRKNLAEIERILTPQ